MPDKRSRTHLTKPADVDLERAAVLGGLSPGKESNKRIPAARVHMTCLDLTISSLQAFNQAVVVDSLGYKMEGDPLNLLCHALTPAGYNYIMKTLLNQLA